MYILPHRSNCTPYPNPTLSLIYFSSSPRNAISSNNMKTHSTILSCGWLLLRSLCCATATQEPVKPTYVPGSAVVIANVTDPSLSRDSCGSTLIGSRVLWVCRDTKGYKNDGEGPGHIVPNSASWSDVNSDGTPRIVHNAPAGSGSNHSNPVVLLYGGSYNTTDSRPFYPLNATDEDAPYGFNYTANTRFATWPGQPPMVANSSGSVISAYTWIDVHDIFTNTSGEEVTSNQPTSLYRFDFNTDVSAESDAPPMPTQVNERFWPQDEWGYGAFLAFVNGSTAYLYAQNDNRTAVALARVSINSIEDIDSYQYYVNDAWTKTRPSLTESSAYIPNLSGPTRQGTVYWSPPFQSFIYIGSDGKQTVNASHTCDLPTNGQSGLGCLEFFISTAPKPEGPWEEPSYFYSVPKGNGTLGAYSVQAHPEYVPNPQTNKSMYITYTQRWSEGTYDGGNVHPLIYLEFE